MAGPKPNAPDVLDVNGVCEHLGIHQNTARKLLAEGRIPGVKIGGVWRIRKADLDALLPGQL